MLVNILGNTINTEGIYRIGPIYPEEKFAIAYKFKIMFFNDKDMVIERSVGEDVTFEDLGEEVTDSYKKNWPLGNCMIKIYAQGTDQLVIAKRTYDKISKLRSELENIWQGHQSPILKLEY